MRQTISNSDENIEILNKLIINGFYTGNVGPERFELTPKGFPNNHRLIGIINENGNYDLRFDYKPPMNILGKIVVALGVLTIIISLLSGNWILPIVIKVFLLVFFISFKLKARKEINGFTYKILEFHKSEYE